MECRELWKLLAGKRIVRQNLRYLGLECVPPPMYSALSGGSSWRWWTRSPVGGVGSQGLACCCLLASWVGGDDVPQGASHCHPCDPGLFVLSPTIHEGVLTGLDEHPLLNLPRQGVSVLAPDLHGEVLEVAGSSMVERGVLP